MASQYNLLHAATSERAGDQRSMRVKANDKFAQTADRRAEAQRSLKDRAGRRDGLVVIIIRSHCSDALRQALTLRQTATIRACNQWVMGECGR